MKSHIITLVIGFSIGILCYHFAGKTEAIEKPVVTVDSTYYWVSASQIDTLKHLRARVDSFTVSARKRSVAIYPKAVSTVTSTVTSAVDTPQIASNEPILVNVYECDTTFARGMDSNKVSVSFSEFPEPRFSFVSKFNDDHILVKEKVTTITLPAKKKFITHGFSIGPGFGLFSKKPDIVVGYTFTLNF